jgi:aspartyl-tRNA(Asn)/glutamyl-tRNA(Gln) amidotransferase subunit C
MSGRDGLSLDEVRRIARLSRLELSQERLAQCATRLSALLEYVRRMGELDLSGVEPLPHVGEETGRMDEDEPGEVLPVETLMRMAPDPMPPFFKVPKVLDEEAAT